jgi:pilus assembly protein Flp/PilA
MAEHLTPMDEPQEPASVELPEVVDETAETAVEAREAGQGLVEYGLIIFLVAIVVIAILLLVGPRIGSIFSRIVQLG